ncbi:MAG: TauD/TfdA family dioxygenase [Ornithinimicrobium sp.]
MTLVSDVTAATPAQASPTDCVVCADRHLILDVAGVPSRVHYVWLRDNCWCSECKVLQSGERRLYTADILDDIAAVSASLTDGGALEVHWNDGHHSAYSMQWLDTHRYERGARSRQSHQPTLWAGDLVSIPTFEHQDVVGTDTGQLAYLDAMRDYGVALVRHTPSVPGEVERFAETLGHVRETAFERIHNVQHDPHGYNVAHTPIELKPHTDLPSYHWPPSVQLLHFLVNEATGGESTVLDGWAVLADLRAADPAAFDTLASTAVPYQLFSDDEDTAATAPMIGLDSAGEVQTFRYSNQLAQPLAVDFEEVEEFYRAYRVLGRMINGPKYKLPFKTQNGDLLTVHGHRVLHGRLAFDPASGGRHLQDVYMDFDDLMARRRVLLGTHKPLSALGEAV